METNNPPAPRVEAEPPLPAAIQHAWAQVRAHSTPYFSVELLDGAMQTLYEAVAEHITQLETRAHTAELAVRVYRAYLEGIGVADNHGTPIEADVERLRAEGKALHVRLDEMHTAEERVAYLEKFTEVANITKTADENTMRELGERVHTAEATLAQTEATLKEALASIRILFEREHAAGKALEQAHATLAAIGGLTRYGLVKGPYGYMVPVRHDNGEYVSHSDLHALLHRTREGGA